MVDEVRRLRTELGAARATSAQALARATRLAQLVSSLGRLTDVMDILDRAVCEVAEQFSADVAVVLMPADDRREGMRVAAQWGLAEHHVPTAVGPSLPQLADLTSTSPVVAGPVADFAPPDWLLASCPRHLACGLLAVRAERLGCLLLARRADEPFELFDLHELAAVVSRIALAVDNGLLYRRTQEQLGRFRRLHELTAALAGIVDLERAVSSVAETLVAEVPVAGVAVYLADELGLTLAGRAGTVTDLPERLADRQPLERPGVTLIPLGASGVSPGVLLVTGAPTDGSQARIFLDHLVDISGLVLEKSVLFEQIRAQAESDPLTGLPNRSLFMDRLATALRRRHLNESDLAVIFIDLDRFKEVNDTHGHDAGDQLLAQVARRLAGAVRKEDTIARLGGDEFVILCEDVTSDEINGVILERVQRALDAPYRLHLHETVVEVMIGGSIGSSIGSDVQFAASALLRNADAAMYSAKQSRRNVRAKVLT